MDKIDLYPEMNKQISGILRLSERPEQLYAADLIDDLLKYVAHLRRNNLLALARLQEIVAFIENDQLSLTDTTKALKRHPIPQLLDMEEHNQIYWDYSTKN